MYYLCQRSLSVLGKQLAQNSDNFKLYRFPACIEQIIMQEVQGSWKVISYMEAFILWALVSFMLARAEPDDLDRALSDINYICASKISSDKDIQDKDISKLHYKSSVSYTDIVLLEKISFSTSTLGRKIRSFPSSFSGYFAKKFDFGSSRIVSHFGFQ